MSPLGRRCRLVLLLAAILGATIATAAAQDPGPMPPPVSYYANMLSVAQQTDQLGDRLLWGRLIEPLPAHTFGAQLDYRTRRYDSRYFSDGRIGNVIRPWRVADPGRSGEPFFRLRTVVNGLLQILNPRLAYGLLDHLAVFGEFPIVRQEASLDFHFTPGASREYGVQSEGDLFRLLERFGRPRIDRRYDANGWQLGDARAGLNWIALDSETLTFTTQFAAVFPTGRLADPNQDQRFGQGAQVDLGQGSFGVGSSHAGHLRLPKPYNWIGFWIEGSADYYFPGNRRRPDWDTPDPAFEDLRRVLDRADGRFPDLSNASRTYTVTPGIQLQALSGLTFKLAYFSVGFGYLYRFAQEPVVDAESPLKRFMRANDAFLSEDDHAIVAQLGIPLTPVWIPGVFNLAYAYSLGGRNGTRYEDALDLQTLVVFPF